ncbi:MAG TPA: UDP-3-O-(3-hydroxymyristoyl)glucosamine N-acyltransferase [Candidatus Cybelea sp.]|nr:UDP-3-O-(3-hydroxymyristoyl)glucosamine N-acyltransferase [Candidatus Cybelea sp.]
MSHSAAELAKYLEAGLSGNRSAQISGVASPERATASDLIYVDSERHLGRAEKSAASCILARPGTRAAGKTIIEVKDPKLAFAKAAVWLLPAAAPAPGVHSTAIVPPTARLGASVSISAYVVLEDGVEIGRNAIIEPFCFIGRGARIGDDCRLHPRVTLYAGARLGNRVEVHAGATIGSDGFGYVPGDGRQWKFPQIGSVEVGDDVEIGAGATIDRGSLESTVIGKGVKIDNLVHIAHNVNVGEHTVIAAQTGISGSSTLGKNVVVGGQVGIADHCTLEDGAVAGAQAGIPTGKIIRSGQTVWGTPARPLDRFKQQYAWFARLPELAARLRKLEDAQGNR